MTRDRVGLLWRPELATQIFRHLHRIDALDVIAEDWLRASSREARALRTLGASVPLSLHGVSMGLASCAPVDPKRLAAMARLTDIAQPESWSEHLAFVRGGGIELGHLAAPPRTAETIEGTLRNVMSAESTVGSRPLLENVATLIDPPGSTHDEVGWLRRVLDATGADLLLDLHNLHANGMNFGFDSELAIRELPPDRIRAVHVAGGRWIGAEEPRLLDDHLHDVPEAVYRLLEVTAEHATHPLRVILERDGHHPPFEVVLAQLDRTRDALLRGRARRSHEHRL